MEPGLALWPQSGLPTPLPQVPKFVSQDPPEEVRGALSCDFALLLLHPLKPAGGLELWGGRQADLTLSVQGHPTEHGGSHQARALQKAHLPPSAGSRGPVSPCSSLPVGRLHDFLYWTPSSGCLLSQFQFARSCGA